MSISHQLLNDILQINYLEHGIKNIDQLEELDKYYNMIILKRRELVLRDREKEFQIISQKYGIGEEIISIDDVIVNNDIWVAIYDIDNTNYLTRYSIFEIILDPRRGIPFISGDEILLDSVLSTNLWKNNNSGYADISFKNNCWKIEYLDKDYLIKVFKNKSPRV